MIVSDMDGTLLNQDLKITKKSAEVIKAVQEQNIIFTIASGRSHYMMNDYYTFLGMFKYSNGYMIGLNGIELYSFKDRKIEKYQSLTYQQSMNITKAILDFNMIPILMYDEETIIINNSSNQDEAKLLLNILDNDYQGAFPNVKIRSLKEVDMSSVNKFCILYNCKYIRSAIDRLKKNINDTKIVVLKVGNEWIEIMPSNINKAMRIEEIMKKEHIHQDEIVVFGDSQNDIEMLKMTPNSYAMKNASFEVQQHAGHIADTNDNDGVAKILEKLCL